MSETKRAIGCYPVSCKQLCQHKNTSDAVLLLKLEQTYSNSILCRLQPVSHVSKFDTPSEYCNLTDTCLEISMLKKISTIISTYNFRCKSKPLHGKTSILPLTTRGSSNVFSKLFQFKQSTSTRSRALFRCAVVRDVGCAALCHRRLYGGHHHHIPCTCLSCSCRGLHHLAQTLKNLLTPPWSGRAPRSTDASDHLVEPALVAVRRVATGLRPRDTSVPTAASAAVPRASRKSGAK